MGVNPLNDFAIKVMCENPNYRIHETGEIHTLITATGKKSVKGIWRTLAIKHCKDGYASVRYQKRYLRLHRIIAQKFIGDISGFEINHKDGNPSNNDVSNLELVTKSENQLHSYRVLGRKPSITNAKLTLDEVKAIKDLLLKGIPNVDLAKHYKVSTATISEIKTGKIWAAV